MREKRLREEAEKSEKLILFPSIRRKPQPKRVRTGGGFTHPIESAYRIRKHFPELYHYVAYAWIPLLTTTGLDDGAVA